MRSPRRTAGVPGAPPAALLAVVACILIGQAPRPGSVDLDAPAPGWREGPVRYLLTQEEDQTYKRLESEEERARFISRFWAARDPDRSTPENEYRALFHRRVEDASRLFRLESTKPGWKTDRGKIYILLGPPDDISQQPFRSQGPEIIVWTYREPPPGADAGPNTQVGFARDASGEYRMTLGARSFLSETALSRVLALQALQMRSLPDARPVRGDADEPEAQGAPAPLRMRAGFFRAGNGRTLVVLTVWARENLFDPEQREVSGEVPPPAAPFREAVARLVVTGGGGSPADSGGSTVLRIAEGPLARGPDGSRVFQGGLVVRPGDYDAQVALLGEDSSTLHELRQHLSVPDFEGGALAIGPIAFASHLERLEAAPWAEYTAPFLLGRLRVVPRYDTLFHQGEELAFYYQVLGGSTDPIEGLPDLDLEYRFLTAGETGDDPDRARPFGHAIHLTHEQSQVQGFSLPLAGWPPGAYRLEVIVTDNLTGGTARSEARFQVR